MNGNAQQMQFQNPFAHTVPVNAKSFGAKYRTKREVYRFLTHDCGAYLSSYETMTIFHLKDLMAGKRRRIKAVDVKVITVPHFKGLKVEAMFAWAKAFPEVMRAFPTIQREIDDLPRPYVANVINTIKPLEFATWVNRKVDERHEARTVQQDNIQMDAEINACYLASNATSVGNGMCHNLLKAGSKRRRTKQEINHVRQAEAERLRDIEAKVAQYDRMHE